MALAVVGGLVGLPSTALAGGTNVGVTIIGVGRVSDNHGLTSCSSSGSRVDCDANYYNSGWDVTFTAAATDARWRFDRWVDNGPDKISCNTTSTQCSFTSGTCVFCAYDDRITATFVVRDDDGDGYNALVDCNDHAAGIHPGAYDIPHDGIDQDCGGGDNLDGDRDGYNAGPGPDCNDTNAAVHPGATEVRGDGIDENCDGPPETTLAGAVPSDVSPTSATVATFSFSSPANPGWNESFQCRLDAGQWAPCTSPRTVSGLTDGRHTFEIQGRDSDGLVDPTPARAVWTVDTTPPDTQITTGPSDGSLTNATAAAFTFGSEAGARFECSVDGGAFGPCNGLAGHTIGALALGDHSLLVRALDAAGNADPSPAQRKWRVTADVDGDGYVAPGDCDDNAAAVHPNAVDAPHDGIDQDCDGHDNLDADSDGVNAGPGPDCNDRDATIKPGAADAPGDKIDQDCDGHDAGFPQLASAIGAQWSFKPFRFTKLYVKRVAAGSTIEVRCQGRGCSFARRTIAMPKASALASLKKVLRPARLRRGDTLTITVTKSGYDGVMRRYTIRGASQDPVVADFCVPAAGGKPTAC